MQFNLKGLVESHGNLKWEKKLSILNDVCFGLQYLHSRNPPIVHQGLTPNNILLCSHFRAKITDLAFAKLIHGNDTKILVQALGTQDFMPPEFLSNKSCWGLPLDIFSFGGVILYICTHQWPQPAPLVDFDPDTGNRFVATELIRRQQYLDQMFGVYADLKSLVISCLDDNPKNRPLVTQVIMEVKRVKNSYNNELPCNKISAPGEQSAAQKDQQQEPLPKLQQVS